MFSDTSYTNYKHMETLKGIFQCPQKLTNVIQTSQNSLWLSLRSLNKWYGVFAPQYYKFSHNVLAPGAQPGRHAFDSCLITYIHHLCQTTPINLDRCLKQALNSSVCQVTFTISGHGPVETAKNLWRSTSCAQKSQPCSTPPLPTAWL